MASIFKNLFSPGAVLVLAVALVAILFVPGLQAGFSGPRSPTFYSIPRVWAYCLFAVPILLYFCHRLAWRKLDRSR